MALTQHTLPPSTMSPGWDPASLDNVNQPLRQVLNRSAGIFYRLISLAFDPDTWVFGITTMRAMSCADCLGLWEGGRIAADSYIDGGRPAFRCTWQLPGRSGRCVNVYGTHHPSLNADNVRQFRVGDSQEARGLAVLSSLALQHMGLNDDVRSSEQQAVQLAEAASFIQRFSGVPCEGRQGAASLLAALRDSAAGSLTFRPAPRNGACRP